jgi:hypothetical protein
MTLVCHAESSSCNLLQLLQLEDENPLAMRTGEQFLILVQIVI